MHWLVLPVLSTLATLLTHYALFTLLHRFAPHYPNWPSILTGASRVPSLLTSLLATLLALLETSSLPVHSTALLNVTRTATLACLLWWCYRSSQLLLAAMIEDERRAHLNADQRVQALREVVASEESYVAALRVCLASYLKPLCEFVEFEWTESGGQSSAAVHHLPAIHAQVESIAQLHSDLLAALQRVGADGDLAGVFLEYADYLRLYTAYVSAYDGCLAAMNELWAHEASRTVLQQLRAKREVRNLDLLSYLIMPVQRIPRYSLLLREVIKYTPDWHEHAESLKQARDKVELIAGRLNERKREIENMSTVVELQNRVSSVDWEQIQGETLMLPTRHLIKHGLVLLRANSKRSIRSRLFGRTDNPFKNRQLALFNDMIMWMSDSFKFKGSINMHGADIALDSLPERAHVIRISGCNPKSSATEEQAVLHIAFDSEPALQEWLSALLAAYSASEQAHHNSMPIRRAKQGLDPLPAAEERPSIKDRLHGLFRRRRNSSSS